MGWPGFLEKVVSPFGGSLQRNALFLMANSTGTAAVSFLFWMVIGRYYDVVDVGIAVTLSSAGTLLSLLSTFGFDFAVIRYLPNRSTASKNSMFNSCLNLSLASAIFSSIIFFIVVALFIPEFEVLTSDPIYMVFFVLFVMFGTASPIINSTLISEKRSSIVLLRDVGIMSLGKLVLVFFVVPLGSFGIFSSWTLSMMISAMVGLVVLLPWVIKNWKYRIEIDMRHVKRLIKFALVNYLGNIFYIGPSLFFPIMIATILAPEYSAYFRVAWIIASMLYMVPAAVSFSLFAEGSSNRRSVRQNMAKSVKLIFALTIPALAVLYIFGYWIISLIGLDYAQNSIEVVQILAIASVPLAVNNIYIAFMRIKKHNSQILAAYSGMAVISLTISIFTIHNYGLMGIAYSWLIAQAIISLFTGTALIRYWGRRKFKRVTRKPSRNSSPPTPR